MTAELDVEAVDFANRLNELFESTIGRSVQFEVVESASKVRTIGPGPVELANAGFAMIPLRRAVDSAAEPEKLALKVEFVVGLDDEETHLTVQRSTFGLWVRPDPKRTPKPVVRVEYDRDARNKPAAHVHLHAESVELGWLYGTAGLPLPRLEEVHFPVGGRRFRPSIEELLLFLDRERLYNDWASADWRTVIEASQEEWDERQARATARRHPEATAGQLRLMGYDVTAPPSFDA